MMTETAGASLMPFAMREALMHNILLVDENRDELKALGARLVESGHRVIARSDVLAAVKTVRDGARIDVIITEYELPATKGLEYLSDLLLTAPSIPVIVLTAHASIETYLQSINIGVFEYMHKPVEEKELLRIISAACLNARRTDDGFNTAV